MKGIIADKGARAEEVMRDIRRAYNRTNGRLSSFKTRDMPFIWENNYQNKILQGRKAFLEIDDMSFNCKTITITNKNWHNNCHDKWHFFKMHQGCCRKLATLVAKKPLSIDHYDETKVWHKKRQHSHRILEGDIEADFH